MTDFTIKENDTSPALTATLQDDDGAAVDITGASVRFHMVKLNETATKIDAAADIVSEALGQVKYQWLTADTDTAGIYRGEWEVTYSDGTIETFPNDDMMEINIYEDLA